MKSVSFVGAGDLLIQTTEPSVILRHVAEELSSADVTYLNLEGPTTDRGEKNPALAGIANGIRSRPDTVAAMAALKVDVVSLANNHTMDYGLEGLSQTLELLAEHGIAQCGGGLNAAQARTAAFVEKDGMRIGFLSYTAVCPPVYAATQDRPGAAFVAVNTTYEENRRIYLQPGSPQAIRTKTVAADLAQMKEEIAAARQNCDALIVAWHWGISERWGKLAEYQQECGHACIEAGADMVLGNHAHMLQGVEFYQGKPIFYSLGNFAFDMKHRFFLPENLLVKCDITRSGLKNLRIVPLINNPAFEPEIARGDAAQRIQYMLEDLNYELNTRLTRIGDEIHLSPRDETSDDA